MSQRLIKTVLLTDSSTIDRLIVWGLGETRYDVRTLYSKDAPFFQEILDFQPELIFLKAELGHARGVDVCHDIKTHEALQQTKVVFLSSSPNIREQAVQHKADHFLSLPFTVQDLAAVATLLTADKFTVLYVDDSDMMHRAVVPALRDEGYELLEAWDGQEALELIDQAHGKINLILSDVEMPVMNGYQLCESVHATLSEDIPFILLTSLDTEDAILRGFDVGADDYILKPVVLPELLSRVRRLLTAEQRRGVARMERILVVDDSDLIVRMVTKALRAQGFHVDSAEHGLAALSKLREHPYHLLVTDFEMPHMDGLELCQRIRNGETGHPNMPILFATTRTTKTDIVRMRSIGAQAVIAKPFTPERVVADVERVLAEIQLEQQYRRLCHFFPEYMASSDTSRNFQDPTFADDQFRTLLSARIIHFSTLAKQLTSKEVVTLMNSYVHHVARVLEHEGLVIEKQVEDRISVSFGGQGAHTVQAIQTALAIQSAMPALAEKTGHAIQIGVAVHAGHVILGNIETQYSGQKPRLVLFGEHCQTVRSILDHIQGGEILISDACRPLVQSAVELAEAGTVNVVDKSEPMPVFRATALKAS